MATIQHRPEVGKKLKIDKGIPFPEKSRGYHKTKYIHDALDVMEVGDSIEFSVDAKRRGNQLFSKEGERFYAVARNRGIRLSTRLSNDRDTVRYWRVE